MDLPSAALPMATPCSGSLDAAAEADVIVLDWRLPNISGIDLLPELRRRGVNLPVVFLTSHAAAGDTSNSLSSAVRSTSSTKHAAWSFWPCVSGWCPNSGKPAANPKAGRSPSSAVSSFSGRHSHRAYWNEVDVGLTVGEYNIVHLLVSNVGRYETYRAIYDASILRRLRCWA